MKLSEQITGWMEKEVRKAGKKGIVFGLSGGLDSAVVGALAGKAVGENALGLVLPCKNKPEDTACALKVAEKFGIKVKQIPLDKIFDDFVKLNPQARDLAKGNLKPRLRMTTLYYFANTLDYLVAGTGNKSELAIGYFTKYGDGGADILPLGRLLKSEVRELARDLDVPDEIIKRPPSADLWEGQTDEGEIGITYEELDRAIDAIEKKKTEGINKEILARVRKLIADSEHKRRKIPTFIKR